MSMTPRGKAYALALAVWPVFLVTAILLGLVRETVLGPVVGEQAAHVIGTLGLIAVMLGIISVFVSRVAGDVVPRDWWLIGAGWTAMTVAFEFLFFHFVAGVPWETLLANYNLRAGRLWVLVLLTTLCGPAVIGRWWRSDDSRVGRSDATDRKDAETKG